MKFPKSHRLLEKMDFAYMRKGASYTQTKSMRIYYKRSRVRQQFCRLGIAVSKKVGKANRRNLIKRIIRESFRKNLELHSGQDLLVVLSPRTLKSLDRDSLRQVVTKDIHQLLEQFVRGIK